MSEIVNPVPDPAENLKRLKLVLLGAMLLLSGAFAVLYSIFASVPGWDRALFMVDSLSFTVCLAMWCGYDARLHGFRLSRGLRWTIILMGFIGFPFYAFSSRGRGGWALLGLGLLFFALVLVVSAGFGWAADVLMGNLD